MTLPTIVLLTFEKVYICRKTGYHDVDGVKKEGTSDADGQRFRELTCHVTRRSLFNI